MARLLSLAAGVHPDLEPSTMVSTAAAAGWPACGIWCDPTTWSNTTTMEVRRRLDDTGVVALDLEPIIPTPGIDDHGEYVIDVAAEIGAQHVLFTSRLPDLSATIERFASLCAIAAQHGVKLVCEFLPIFPLSSLRMAMQVVGDHPPGTAGILVDNLHLARSGGSVADLTAVPLNLMPYLQIADAAGPTPQTAADLLEEAVHGRLLPGEGDLPIKDLLVAVPNVALSFEVRSTALHERFPDPVDRARHLFERVCTYADR
jgi:sugar phosphate isomerase/epimerase